MNSRDDKESGSHEDPQCRQFPAWRHRTLRSALANHTQHKYRISGNSKPKAEDCEAKPVPDIEETSEKLSAHSIPERAGSDLRRLEC